MRKSHEDRREDRHFSTYVTFVRSCNVALWDISLYLVEWRTCVVIRMSDRHPLASHLWIIRSHWDGSPIMQPWYYLQRWISAGVKFPPSLHLKLSHRGGCGELAQDSRMQTAVWKRLLSQPSCGAVIDSMWLTRARQQLSLWLFVHSELRQVCLMMIQVFFTHLVDGNLSLSLHCTLIIKLFSLSTCTSTVSLEHRQTDSNI